MQPEKEADKAVSDSSVRRHTSVARFWEELPGIVVALDKMTTRQDVKTKLEGEYTRLLNVPCKKFLGNWVWPSAWTLRCAQSLSLLRNWADLVGLS